jgi:ParB-like chromosome segregation protein Spo0J
MKYEMHEVCAAWPEMTTAELRDLADDIVKNGLHDPIMLTPDGKLLDGRNRAEACAVAGIEITSSMTAVYDGDPVLFSLSKNRHRRHMSTDQIAMVAAKLATREHGGDRRSEDFKTSNEGLKVSAVAEAAGVPKTAVESAKAVLKHGVPEDIDAVRTGKAKLRKTADAVRARRAPPKPSADPIDDVTRALIQKFDGPNAPWTTVDKIARALQYAPAAVQQALERLGDKVAKRPLDISGLRFEYHIEAAHAAPVAHVEFGGGAQMLNPSNDDERVIAAAAQLVKAMGAAEPPPERIASALAEIIGVFLAGNSLPDDQIEPTAELVRQIIVETARGKRRAELPGLQ